MSKPPKEPSILGTWRGDRFDFASPAAREAWHRSAYGQAVDPETWHLGDPVDPETERAIGLGIGGAQPPAYRGPDGQSRFGNSRTLERADLRAIRQRAFAGKSIEEIEDAYDTGTLLPGEEEAVHLLLGTPQARKRPPAITPAPVAQTDYANPESAMRSLFGMDPDAPRPNILPDPRGADGEFTSDVSQWTAPQLLYDLAKAFVTPRVAIEGGKVSDADALNLALSTAGGGVAKTASHGAIGMPQVAESLASRQAKLYDGPQVQRPFSKDYPDGYRTDAAGNLTHDIDGNPLEIGNRIVGRSVAGGADEALSPTEFDAIAKAGTGRSTQVVAPSKLRGSGVVGQVVVNRYSRLPEEVNLSNKLTPEELPGVYGHEIGHVVDQLAKEIPVAGLSKELKKLYDVGNNPNRARANSDLPAEWGKRYTPEAAGYQGDDIPREWMAEAIRLYMANPSYLKEVAPNTALAIRQAVNRDPVIARIIQFNSGGAPLGLVPTSSDED